MSFWRSTHGDYAGLAKFFHWLSALTVVGLFFLGLWMVDLTYYDNWYRTAPDLHRSIGLSLALLTLLRLIYRALVPYPAPLATHSRRITRAARAVHLLLYILLFVMFVSGYLISTAKGAPIEVFGLFEIPSLVNGIDNLEDAAGEVHELAAYSLVGLAILHALAALKHHLIDRDHTLVRMAIRRKKADP